MTEENFRDNRVEKIEELDSEGVDPYQSFPNTEPSSVGEFVEEYQDQEDIESEETWVLAGRVDRINHFGDFVFYDVDDRTGSVQVMCTVDDRNDFRTENFESLDNVSMDDWMVFRGAPGRSNTGELTLYANSYEFATPALTETVDDYSQLRDDSRVTNRTQDLIADDVLFDSVQTRFHIEQYVRDYLTNNGFLEVRTPTLHNIAGGAEATPFTTHCNGIDQEMYLRIAPELYLKRLITAGYDSVFEVAQCFRNEDIDTTHNPEFTLMELYSRFDTYEDMMEITENLFATVATRVTGDTTVNYDGTEIDFETPWNRQRFDDLIEQYVGQSPEELTQDDVVDYLASNHDVNPAELEDIDEFGDLLTEVFDEAIESELQDPVFVYDYPASSTPLCKRVEGDDSRVQRFEAFVSGTEIANAYTELTDPREQRERLIQQVDEHEVNENFVNAIAHGMPPTAGLGIGLERMAMFMTDSQSIKDVMPYPLATDRI